MNILLKERGAGKTIDLLFRADKFIKSGKRPLIVTKNWKTRFDLIESAKLHGFDSIKFDNITDFNHFIEDICDETKYDEVFIDDADLLLQYLTDLKINTITLNNDEQ